MRTLCISTMLIWLVLVGWFRETRGRWVQLMDVRNKLHIEGDGEANILSFFCVRFSRKEEGQVLYLFSGVTYYLSRGEGGGGGGRKEEVWGITWFSLLPESIQTGLWTNYQEGGGRGGHKNVTELYGGSGKFQWHNQNPPALPWW